MAINIGDKVRIKNKRDKNYEFYNEEGVVVDVNSKWSFPYKVKFKRDSVEKRNKMCDKNWEESDLERI
jgi:predicted Zn-dependent protease